MVFCVKIKSMKTLRKSLTVLLSFICLLCFWVILFSQGSVNAESSPNVSLFIPRNESEYFELDSPTGFCKNNGQLAVIQQNGSLLWYKDGEYTDLKDKLVVKNPHQIEFFSSTKLLISDNEILYIVDLEDLSTPAEQLKFGTEPVSGRCFDLNENYLITISGTTIFTYKITNGVLTSKGLPLQNAKDNTPVCMNDNNEIFYIASDYSLKKHVIDGSTADTVLINNISPSTVMASDNDFVYYTDLNTIKRISTDGNTTQTLSLKNADDYEIGKIVSPIDIYLSDGNLFITDYIASTVTEYIINENDISVYYSGFAIAKGKTAFNRISDNILDYSKFDDSVGYLDNYKLTIITQNGNEVTYKNFLQSKLNSSTLFSLGKDDALLYSEIENKFFLLNTFTGETSVIEHNLVGVSDIIYFNNRFYVLTEAEQTVNVFTLVGEEFSNVFTKALNVSSPKLAIDTQNTLYIANVISGDNFAVYTFKNGQEGTKLFTLPEKASSIELDFANQIVLLSPNNVYVYSNGIYSFKLYDKQGEKTNVTSLSFDKVNKSAFVTFYGDERIYLLTDTPFISIQDISTDNFIISDKNADFSALNGYKVNDSVIYSVNENIDKTTTFDFNMTQSNSVDTFALIVSKTLKLADGTDCDFLILAGEYMQGGTITVIIPKSHATAINLNYTEIDYEKAYVTTSVNMYYLPIITLSGKYCLTDNGEIRIGKDEQISVSKIITFLNRQFYLAEYVKTEDNVTTTYTGYIPVDFTVKILSKDIIGENFELKETENTTLKTNLGETIYTVTEKTLVKCYYSLENGTSFVAVFDGENWIKGYIDSNAFVVTKNDSIKTAIIIVLASTSILFTSVYIVLKKKN